MDKGSFNLEYRPFSLIKQQNLLEKLLASKNLSLFVKLSEKIFSSPNVFESLDQILIFSVNNSSWQIIKEICMQINTRKIRFGTNSAKEKYGEDYIWIFELLKTQGITETDKVEILREASKILDLHEPLTAMPIDGFPSYDGDFFTLALNYTEPKVLEYLAYEEYIFTDLKGYMFKYKKSMTPLEFSKAEKNQEILNILERSEILMTGK